MVSKRHATTWLKYRTTGADKQTRLPEKRSRKVRDMYKADMGLNRVIRVANDYSQRHMNNEA